MADIDLKYCPHQGRPSHLTTLFLMNNCAYDEVQARNVEPIATLKWKDYN